MPFTVPSREPQGDEEFITVVNEPAPRNLPSMSLLFVSLVDNRIQLIILVFTPPEKEEEEQEQEQQEEEEEEEEPSTSEIPSIPEEKVQPANIPTSKCCPNCKHAPHDTFPGIEHYFIDSTNTFEEVAKSAPLAKKAKIISFKKGTDNDDDDDVMMGNDFQ